MSIFITGVAGFIGCNLAKTFLDQGETVFGIDNFCRGLPENLKLIADHPRFQFAQADLADLAAYRAALLPMHAASPITEVWHMAANSDIPAGIADANVDHRDTFLTTFNSLILMKELGIGVIAFASSSAIYGDLGERPLTEDIGPLFPISNYGAMKLASEAAISAAVESHLKQAFIFRFPNVIGTPATHGVLLDFVRKLKATPEQLVVLGDGTQRKCYLHVDELVDAMQFIRKNGKERVNYFNIGATDEGVNVKFIAESVVAQVSPNASIQFGQGNKGWVGDVPKVIYSVEKLLALGWKPTLGSAQAIVKSVKQIAEQENA